MYYTHRPCPSGSQLVCVLHLPSMPQWQSAGQCITLTVHAPVVVSWSVYYTYRPCPSGSQLISVLHLPSMPQWQSNWSVYYTYRPCPSGSLTGKCITLTVHAPVVAGIICDKGHCFGIDPLPENHLLCHVVCLHLTLHLYVEDLKGLPSYKQ